MHQILMKNLYNYARENLALVNIYIKQPVVTKILRDQRIPVIWFVANCGGILGLCMGFSIVTVFEVLHCLTNITFTSLASWYRNVRPYFEYENLKNSGFSNKVIPLILIDWIKISFIRNVVAFFTVESPFSLFCTIVS